MSLDINDDRLIELEAKVQELETRFDGIAGILGVLQPVARLLESCGALETRQLSLAVYEIVDEMSARLNRGEAVSFTEFEERLTGLVPPLSSNRRFFELLVEALRVEKRASARLCVHFTRAMALLRS
jgi:hypothetical protein